MPYELMTICVQSVPLEDTYDIHSDDAASSSS